jgi:MFS family permease
MRGNTGPGGVPVMKTPRLRDYLAISLFWLPISLFWGAMLGQLLPERVLEFSGPAAKGSYLATISALGAFASTVVQLVIGAMSDACGARWGKRRPFIFWGTLMAVPALFLFVQAQSFALLIVAFLLIQFWLNVANGPYQAFIPDHIPPDAHGRAATFMGIAQLLGQAGGPLLAGIVLSLSKGEHPLFSHSAALLLIVTIIAALLIVCMAVTLMGVPDAPAEARNQRPAREVVRASFRLRPDWRGELRHEARAYPDFYWLLASRTFVNLAFYTVLSFLPFFVQDALHFGDGYNQPLMTIQILATVGSLLGTIPAGLLADRMSKKLLVQISCGLVAVGSACIAFLTHIGAARVLALVFGIGWGAFAAVDWALACNLLPAGGAARYMAIWHVCMTVPQVIAPLLFGRAGDAINAALGQGMGWRGAMLTAVIYVIIGATLIRKVREPGRVPGQGHTPSKIGS